jgi:hypothetical protein
MLAAMFGHVEAVRTLVELGADPLRRNLNRSTGGLLTPIHAAAENGFLKVIMALVELNGDVVCEDLPVKPIFLAAKSGNVEPSKS